MSWDLYDDHCNDTCLPDCEFCAEAREEDAMEQNVHAALLAALKDRVEVAGAYIGLDTPAHYLDRMAVLRYAADHGHARSVEELKRLHRSAGALLELLAHGAVPEARALS